MEDKFENHSTGLESPPIGGFAITPDDAENLSQMIRALNVGSFGTVRATLYDGSDITLTVSAGAIVPMRARRIWATGTTASGLVGLY